ncbi:MAG: prepilin-type N-terminal cleavage/methylation domain-containing protein [Proteobacteria bacterium]|nr:prepilin-type N-terminal cleavage/methylation domain-containing protein [Desulfobulbaceae bacterium]MBU4153264.1 prepilin-type N-terminal cleavage/methylation domain-containing protein [Pseudomonadota bacterium]MDP2105537.1 prepilin-type N-terminal cleavage/methylation domain-containing protein [Desulfobulbaceae bacterium]
MKAKTRRCSQGFTPHTSSNGFTLLEVMIALAIIAIAFTAMLSSQARNISLATETKFQTTAPLLAQDIMTRSLSATQIKSISEQGEWGDDFPGYRWQTLITPAAMGLDPALQGLFKIDVTVSWQDQTRYTYHQRGYLFIAPPGS